MLNRDPSLPPPAIVPAAVRRNADRRRGPAALLAAVTTVLTGDHRAARERLEEELRVALQARSVALRDDGPGVPPGNAVCFDVPSGHGDGRARLEVVFEAPRPLDDWTCQLIEAGTQLASVVLELERVAGRIVVTASKRTSDGAAPLIGSSEAIRRVRERIERVAATDFTVLIEGGTGPQPHPNFIGVLCGPAVGCGEGEVEGPGEDDEAGLLRITSLVRRRGPVHLRTRPQK